MYGVAFIWSLLNTKATNNFLRYLFFFLGKGRKIPAEWGEKCLATGFCGIQSDRFRWNIKATIFSAITFVLNISYHLPWVCIHLFFPLLSHIFHHFLSFLQAHTSTNFQQVSIISHNLLFISCIIENYIIM